MSRILSRAVAAAASLYAPQGRWLGEGPRGAERCANRDVKKALMCPRGAGSSGFGEGSCQVRGKGCFLDGSRVLCSWRV